MAAVGEARKRPRDDASGGAPGLRKRGWTVSIALPGSIVAIAQSRELQTHLVGVIARTACIFQVDEIVVFNDGCDPPGTRFNSCEFMARLLQYTETPQYMRKALFPRRGDLKLAGLLPPLDAPHHLRADEWFQFREGVVLNRPAAGGDTGGSIVDVGLRQAAAIPQSLVPGVRVTVKLANTSVPKGMKAAHTVGLSTAAQEAAASGVGAAASASSHRKKGPFKGTAVAPSAPVSECGVYWGYTVRMASSLSAALSECPWKEGYDVMLGTSERGEERVDDAGFTIPTFQHLLVVLGGVTGLEEAAMSDSTLAAAGIVDVKDAFDMYVNTCPFQGSRTIRTEEALTITMASLQPAIDACQASHSSKKARAD